MSHILLYFQNQKKRRWWVRPVLQNRAKDGAYANLINKLETMDKEWFFDYLRMTPEDFMKILELIKSDVTKCHNKLRKPISAKERLAITIRHLATGETRISLSFQFLLGRSTVSKIIKETTKAIWDNMKNYIKPPSQGEFSLVAEQFELKWGFPNCIGAIDGKHIRIKCPLNSASEFYCYKKFFSVNLMAIVGADYKFLLIDVGAEGSASDSGVFARSTFGKAIISGSIDAPLPKALGRGSIVPHVFIADEAFPLKCNIMKPFPGGLGLADPRQKTFNYRLSRARMVVENAFGRLAGRWRIFHTTIDTNVETVCYIIKACCALHNFLLSDDSNDSSFNPQEPVPDAWQQRFRSQGTNNHTQLAVRVRNKFMEYFSSPEGQLRNE